MVAKEAENTESKANENIDHVTFEVGNVGQGKEETLELEEDTNIEEVDHDVYKDGLDEAQEQGQDNVEEDKVNEEDPRPPETSPILSIKPKLVTNKRQFPIKEMVASPDDQGSNCCVIVIKSKHTESRIVRQRTILIKRKAVQKVLDKFKEDIFKTMTYHKDIRAVYNVIFHKSAKARKFFSAVNDVLLQDVPKLASVILCNQQLLGNEA